METVTPLAAELHNILSSANAPMKPDSLGRVLHVTGYVDGKGDPFLSEQIDAALQEMILAGRIEKVWRRGVASYRAMNGGSA